MRYKVWSFNYDVSLTLILTTVIAVNDHHLWLDPKFHPSLIVCHCHSHKYRCYKTFSYAGLARMVSDATNPTISTVATYSLNRLFPKPNDRIRRKSNRCQMPANTPEIQSLPNDRIRRNSNICRINTPEIQSLPNHRIRRKYNPCRMTANTPEIQSLQNDRIRRKSNPCRMTE